MKLIDDLNVIYYALIFSHWTHKPSVIKLQKLFAKLEQLLKESKTKYFLNFERYSMVDLYGFPGVSRMFSLKDSALDKILKELNLKSDYPKLT